MPKKFDPNNKHLLLSPQRQERLDVYRVISLIPLQPNHIVADIGCGPGYFAIPLGKSAFYGKVLAVDVQEEMLEATRQELERINLSNVEVLQSEERALPIEDDTLDGAFSAFMVHEAEDPDAIMDEMMRCLHRGGWLALLEWHKRETESGPPVEERIEETELREMAQRAGFRFETRHALNDDQYMLVMRK